MDLNCVATSDAKNFDIFDVLLNILEIFTLLAISILLIESKLMAKGKNHTIGAADNLSIPFTQSRHIN